MLCEEKGQICSGKRYWSQGNLAMRQVDSIVICCQRHLVGFNESGNHLPTFDHKAQKEKLMEL